MMNCEIAVSKNSVSKEMQL